MKYLPLVLISVMCVSGCSDSWCQKDKQLFISDCLEEHGTQAVCSCI